MAKRKDNKGGNSKLQGRYFNPPDYVINVLNNAVKRYESLRMKNGKTEGYERAKGILVEKSITYKQMKRIKNWFDSFKGDWNDAEFKLNGGKTMMNWVNNTLDTATAAIKNIKDSQMNTNPENTHIKTHEKDNNKITLKSTFSIPKFYKGNASNNMTKGPIYEPIGEEIQRMKDLIIYESKI